MTKKIFLKVLLTFAFLFVCSVQTNAQKSNLAEKTLKVTGTATVIIVGSTAKATYKTAKFTTKNVAKPIIVKSAPKVGKFMLDQSGNALKATYPIGKKLFIKYIKYKFLP